MRIGEYLLSVVTAALICSIVLGFIDKKSVNTTIIRLLCGLFLSLTVITPLADLEWADFSDISEKFQSDAQASVADGTKMAEDELSRIIIKETQAYILEKADSMGVDLQVTVCLDEQTPPVPKSVTIAGSVSPYEKSKLSQLIAQDLGIPVEEQTWK